MAPARRASCRGLATAAWFGHESPRRPCHRGRARHARRRRAPPVTRRDRDRGRRRRRHPARHGRELRPGTGRGCRRAPYTRRVRRLRRTRRGILNQDRREDAEIRGAALQRLTWDPEIAAGYLNVAVKDGWVTLDGD